MLTEREPEGFNPGYNISGCFIEVNKEFLLLKRISEKAHGNKWALPGGKAEQGETAAEAAIRENSEETGIDISNRVSFFKTMYERYPEGDFVYHIFRALVDKKPNVVLSSEHSDFMWVSPFQALQMDLIEDLDVCINLLYPPVDLAIGE